MTVFTWSQTASSNATADGTINFAENQGAATYNNSARALMAAVAKWRDDTSGKLVLGGGTTAYTLTTNQTFTSLTDGLLVVFEVNATNTDAVTLNIDGLGAVDVVSSSGVALAPGDFPAGAKFAVCYDASANDLILIGHYGTRKSAVALILDGGGSALTTGVKGYLQVPFACTITAATALSDVSGSVVVDVWKDTYANYPPTDADSITASAPITISSAVKSTDTTLTGWTTSVAAGDILGFNIDSVSTVTKLTITLEVLKS